MYYTREEIQSWNSISLSSSTCRYKLGYNFLYIEKILCDGNNETDRTD